MTKALKHFRGQVCGKERSSGAFAKLRIALYLSVCPHGTFPLLKDGFLWNLICVILLKYAEKIQISLKSDKNIRYFIWRPIQRFDHFYTYIKIPTNAHVYNVLLQFNNYQHVSIASDTIIRVALHEYYKYYKQPNSISGTTQRYDRCLKLPIYWLPNDYSRVLFIWIAVLSPFHMFDLEILWS
jgi:hypothetical protein